MAQATLAIPNVVGPLSELNQSVRVQGQLPGATVTVKSVTRPAGSQVVAEGKARSSDQRFPLLPGKQLTAQDRLVAVQAFIVDPKNPDPKIAALAAEFDPSPEPTGDLAMGVQPKPKSASEIGHVGFVGHVYDCGVCVALSGAIPGATVELRIVASNQILGQKVAEEGTASIGIDPTKPGRLKSGEEVAAHQIVPGVGAGLDTKCTPDALPGPPEGPLPAPAIQPPVHVCDSAVVVTGVIAGTKVRIEHEPALNVAPDLSWWPWSGGGWVALNRDLDQHDKLRIGQEVDPRCKRKATYSGWMGLDPLEPLLPPEVVPPLCAGSPIVPVRNCRPGARVRISANLKTYVYDLPADKTGAKIQIEPLDRSKASSVSATQAKCGAVSEPSVGVPVDPHADVTDPPQVLPPLYECARCVSVTNVHPGAIVQIWARNASGEGPISDFVVLSEHLGTIPVAPYLHKGDEVYVKEWACSVTALRSKLPDPVVQPRPLELQKPTVKQAYSGDTAVEVGGVLPGAFVEVQLMKTGTTSWVYAGSAVADPLRGAAVVYLPPLQKDDQVRARQFLCDAHSNFGEMTVKIPKPQAPKILTPADGAKDVELMPFLAWEDPGAQEDWKATEFHGGIYLDLGAQGYQEVHKITPAPPDSTTYKTPAGVLLESTAYVLAVWGKNSSGEGPYAFAKFTTKKKLPVPVIDSVDPTTWEVKGHGFGSTASVTIHVEIQGDIWQDGVKHPDYRVGEFPDGQADAGGNISHVIVWKSAGVSVNIFHPFGGWETYYFPVSGETVKLKAKGANTDWSGEVHKTAT